MDAKYFFVCKQMLANNSQNAKMLKLTATLNKIKLRQIRKIKQIEEIEFFSRKYQKRVILKKYS